ncbi:MAG: NCS2 family permease [Oscillospiraceae bacterium]|nr:NCS2 family permease [Oscillospiraceae bacterium]
MEKFFKLKERNTTVKTEIIAGITTFATMAYILAVNPGILSESGMEFGRVFSATAIASALATLIMGLSANLPFALSAGMGLNAFFTYTVVLSMGYSWQWALSAIFVEGLIFILLTFCNIREAIVNSIPTSLKHAIGAGIGLFIAYIGLKNAGIIVADAGTVSALSGEWFKGAAGVTMIGLLITGALLIFKVKGALLLGIILTTLVGIPFGVTKYAGGSYLPSAPYFCEFAFKEIFADGRSIFDFCVVVFTFLFVDMFDTVGTLIGCAGKSGIIQKDGSIPNCKQALLADAIGTTAGAMLGTSTVTTFVESASGVSEGGRTGLTAVTVSVLFLLSLFLEPLFGSIPSAATAPALIIVGLMMITPIRQIDYEDYTEGIPAFLCIVLMVCASSISDGIMFGILFYVFTKLITRKFKDLKPAILVVALLFLIKIVLSIIA